ncbi:MAG: hypothetical protein LBS81_01070 [Endomicrobium sp.]|jgi:hypothetical protein|nr:hypothetical protein [Endomicrobium sp.]
MTPIDINEAIKETADIGCILTLPQMQNFLIGITYKNLGSKLKFITQDYNLPQALVFVAAYQENDFYKFTMTLDYNIYAYSDNILSAGISISPVSFLGSRTGK